MIVSRRQALAGAAIGTVAVASAGRAAMVTPPVAIVFDSRIAESVAFARGQAIAGVPLIDLADAGEPRWQSLRTLSLPAGRIVGLTGWTDWVAARGVLEARGLRRMSQASVAAPSSGRSHLFSWSMAR